MITYRLSSDNHRRIASLANWLNVGPDILLKKMVEAELDRCEQVRSEIELTQDLLDKYKLAASLQLLED